MYRFKVTLAGKEYELGFDKKPIVPAELMPWLRDQFKQTNLFYCCNMCCSGPKSWNDKVFFIVGCEQIFGEATIIEGEYPSLPSVPKGAVG